MIQIKPIEIEGHIVLGIEIKLPMTTLLVVTTEKGYVMCGALDIQLLNQKLKDRQIIAGRAIGVRTLEQLLDAPLESVTFEAEHLGIHPGMKGRDAILKIV